MRKLTVCLNEASVRAIRRLAVERRSTQSQIVREALAHYLRRSGRPPAKGIGAYSSGRTDVSERAEELMRLAARQRAWISCR